MKRYRTKRYAELIEIKEEHLTDVRHINIVLKERNDGVIPRTLEEL